MFANIFRTYLFICFALFSFTGNAATSDSLESTKKKEDIISQQADADAKRESISEIVSDIKDGLPQLTLGQSISLVWQRHPLLIAANADLQGSLMDISAARSGFYPFFQVSTRAREDDKESRTDVSVSQPLFRGGFTLRQIDEAKAGNQSALGAYRQTQLDLALATSEAYSLVNANQDKVAAWQSYYDRLVALMATIERRVKEGRAAKVDIDSVNIRVTQAEAGLAISQSQLFESRSQLSTLIFEPITQLTWPDEKQVISDYSKLCVLADCVSEQHPFIISADAEFKRQKAVMGQRNAERFPTLQLTYNKPFAHSGDDPEETLQLEFEYRSDNDLRGYRSAQAGRSRLIAAETRITSSRRDVALDLISTKSRQQASRVQFGAQQRSLEASQQQVDSFIRQYKAGKKTWLEVLNAEREVHQSRLSLIDIQAGFWIANTRLQLQSMDWYSLIPENDFVPYLDTRSSVGISKIVEKPAATAEVFESDGMNDEADANDVKEDSSSEGATADQ